MRLERRRLPLMLGHASPTAGDASKVGGPHRLKKRRQHSLAGANWKTALAYLRATTKKEEEDEGQSGDFTAKSALTVANHPRASAHSETPFSCEMSLLPIISDIRCLIQQLWGNSQGYFSNIVVQGIKFPHESLCKLWNCAPINGIRLASFWRQLWRVVKPIFILYFVLFSLFWGAIGGYHALRLQCSFSYGFIFASTFI